MAIFEKFFVDLLREKKLKKTFNEAQDTRPEYTIPEAVQENVDRAKREFQHGELPGYTDFLDRAAIASANAISASQQGGNALGNISAIQSNLARQERDLGIANQNYRTSMLDRLTNANRDLAQQQQMEFQMNEFAPWLDKYNFNTQMTNLANQRWTTAIDSFSNIGMQIAGAMMGVPMSGTNNFNGNQNVSFRDAMGR